MCAALAPVMVAWRLPDGRTLIIPGELEFIRPEYREKLEQLGLEIRPVPYDSLVDYTLYCRGKRCEVVQYWVP